MLIIPCLAYTPDDTYIHAQFARNVAHGHGYAFNAEEPTYGATSPLWVLLVATGGLLSIDYVLMAKILSVLCTLGAIVAFACLAGSLFDDSTYILASTLAWSVDCWLLRWAASGMETSLSVLMLLIGMAVYARERTAVKATSLFPVYLALLTLARPEGALLFVLVLIDSKVAARRKWKDVMVMTATYLAVLAPWLLYASSRLGTMVPSTFAAKSTLSLPAASSWAFSALSAIKHMASNRLWELVAVLAGIILAVKNRLRSHGTRTRDHTWLSVGAIWIILLPAVYVWQGIPIVSRYLLLVTPVLILLGFRALLTVERHLDRDGHGRSRSLVTASVIIIVLQNSMVSFAVVHPHTRSFSRGMKECLIPIGQWFARETPARTSIAALDIGALGYYAERKVVDLGGLVTPQVLPWLQQYSSEELAETYPLLASDIPRADYLVYRSKQPDGLGARLPYYEHVFTRQMASLGISADPGETYYSVYRIHWEQIKGDTHGPD
jgi:hypothetical protein